MNGGSLSGKSEGQLPSKGIPGKTIEFLGFFYRDKKKSTHVCQLMQPEDLIGEIWRWVSLHIQTDLCLLPILTMVHKRYMLLVY